MVPAGRDSGRLEENLLSKNAHICGGLGPTGDDELDNLSFKVKRRNYRFFRPKLRRETTTMKAITCSLTPNEGDITVGEYSVLKKLFVGKASLLKQ